MSEHKVNFQNIANKFFNLYPNDFIYTGKDWYKINQFGIYIIDPETVLLKEHIYKYSDNTENLENLENKFKFKKILTEMNKYKIITELKPLYKKNNIIEKFNNVNPYIVAFDNGVYDLETNEFRNAKSNEFVTCTTKYNYMIPDIQIVNELNAFFETIFPNQEERRYFLKTISLGLTAVNFQEIYVWICESYFIQLICDLIANTFGNYFDLINIDYLSKKCNYSKSYMANDDINEKIYKRFLITTKSQSNVKLSTGILKELAGGDPIVTESIKFFPKFKLVIRTDRDPLIKIDGGIKRRLRIIRFPIKFADNTFSNLKGKFENDKYKLAFFKILVDHYNNFRELDIPERIKDDTQKYFLRHEKIPLKNKNSS